MSINQSFTITLADYDELEALANSGNFIAYYQKLEQLGDRYATLAQGVASANSFEGNLARKYAENAASWFYGRPVEVSPEDWLTISRGLAQADWAARKDAVNQQPPPADAPAIWTELPWTRIRDYHEAVFDRSGLPPVSWTAKIPLEANEANAPAIWNGILSSTGERLFTQLVLGLEQANVLVDTPSATIAFLIATRNYSALLSILAIDIASDLVSPTDRSAPTVLWFRAMLANPKHVIGSDLTPSAVAEAFAGGAVMSALAGGGELRYGSVDRGNGGLIIGGTRQADNIIGTSLGDLIIAYEGDDIIESGAGDDEVYGLEGSDTFIAGPGNNLYDGGGDYRRFALFTPGDFDVVDYRNAPGPVTIGLDGYAEADEKLRLLTVSNNGFGGRDVLRDIEQVRLSTNAERLAIKEEWLQAQLWIDMGGFGDGPISRDAFDEVSFLGLSSGITMVNGATRRAEPNGPLGGFFSEIGTITSNLFGVPPGLLSFGFLETNNPLRVTGAEKIIATDHDDTLWFGDVGTIQKYLANWPGDDERPKVGEIDGAGGNDVIYYRGIDGDADGIAVTDQLRMTLKGGDGDDRIMSIGGTGTIVMGGAGNDFLFNTSAYGQLFGDSVDAQGNSNGEASGKGRTDSDVFWYWPGTFIMDAKPNDVLQFFGIPMLGGTNYFPGMYSGDGSLAMDWLMPFVFYGYTKGNQLIVYNRLLADVGPDNMKGRMVVEKFDFGGWKDAEWGRPAAGDLGMTFQIVGGVEGSVEISTWNAVWGHLFTRLDVLWNLTKAIRWQPIDDPLVLDLDGDGIETVSLLQSRTYFDLDGDYFAERTGWLSGDDGFLVLDRNGNGRIDDVSEMFGGPGRSGFSQLAEFDTNGDGLVTAADARFGELRVWRDLDGDGFTDNGELFTLDALGIVSLGVTGAPLDIETPQGNRLLARGSFTRADGTTGAMYDMAFDTDPTDTIFRGERGVAEWLRGGVPDARRRVRGRARGGLPGSPWRKTCLMKREDLACNLRLSAF